MLHALRFCFELLGVCAALTSAAQTLAQPVTQKLPRPDHVVIVVEENRAFSHIIGNMADIGVDGIECWHSDHDERMTALCLELAKKYALIPTGGSDFHGSPKPDVKLGLGRSNVRVPIEVLDRLEAKYRQIRHREFV